MAKVTLGLLQHACSADPAANLKKTLALTERAAKQGANIICTQELFRSQYFCQNEDHENFKLAEPIPGPSTQAFQKIAKKYGVVIVASLFEKRASGLYHNTAVIIDADGSLLGIYRKMHIPDDPLYYEKFYFTPGDTGFRAWNTKFGKIGVLICWDQWYPETARHMMLQGAEVLMFPTAIGSEPHDPLLDTRRMWRRAMQGHAVSNVVPVVACNRIGTEEAGTPHAQSFYGTSFIADQRGDIVSELDDAETGVVMATFDLDLVARHRAAFGFFRDRRPELYTRLAQDI